MISGPHTPLNVFIIYARENKDFKDRLLAHLSPLTKSNTPKIRIWVDTRIQPGETWEEKINSIINITDIFLFLVSADSIKSEFISRREFPAALSRQKRGDAILIPILVHPCGWKSVPELSSLNVLPLTDEGRDLPISLWSNHEEAWFSVFKGIEKAVDELLAWRKVKHNPTPGRLRSFIGTAQYRFFLSSAKAKLAKLDEEAWQKAINKNTIAAYEDYLKDFPAGKEAVKAQNQVARLKYQQEKISFDKAKNEGTIHALQKFITQYPSSAHRTEAASLIHALELNEESFWLQCMKEYTIASFQNYIKRYRGRKYEAMATSKIYELTRWQEVLKTDNIPAYKDFIERFPSSPLKKEAEAKIQICLAKEPQFWQNARNQNTVKSYREFQRNYPDSRYATEAESAIRMLDESAFKNAQRQKLFVAYQYYLNEFSDGLHAHEARNIIEHQKRALLYGTAFIALIFISCFLIAWIFSNKSGLDQDNFIYVQEGTYVKGKAGGPRVVDECETIVSVAGFRISKYEVSQADWKSVTGHLPENQVECDECPVDRVSPAEVDSFIQRLNQRVKTKKMRYRLPTENEWEYAALGGAQKGDVMYTVYSGGNDIKEVGWYKENSGGQPHEAGDLEPNRLGLYDMTGNVAEICSNMYMPYPDCAIDPENLNARVVRGGGYNWKAINCRIINRGSAQPLERQEGTGLRLVLEKQ